MTTSLNETTTSSKSKFRKTLTGLTTAAVLTVSAMSAQAAPVTWLFGGLVTSVAPGASGFPPSPGSTALSSLFNIGDPFSLSFSFDDTTIGTLQSNPFTGLQPDLVFANDTTNSISLSGETFTLAAPVGSGNNRRRVLNNGSTEQVESDTDDNTSSGNATSSVAGVDQIFLDWTLASSIGNVLDDVAPSAVVFPDSIDLADWASKTFELFITDSDINASAKVQGTFDTFEIAGSTGVPAPGALALIGFGLMGLAGLRRRLV